jgi:hypothetical protein
MLMLRQPNYSQPTAAAAVVLWLTPLKENKNKMSYVNAPATQLLATNCCCCGRPLVDSVSVELGIGPECRAGETNDITEQQRTLCNKLTHHAAIAAQSGKIDLVRECAQAIRDLGLISLADKVEHRFVNAERLAKIRISEAGGEFEGYLKVVTPFRRGDKAAFISAWRAIPGRRYKNDANYVLPVHAGKVLDILKRFFPGQYDIGRKGPFKIPK